MALCGKRLQLVCGQVTTPVASTSLVSALSCILSRVAYKKTQAERGKLKRSLKGGRMVETSWLGVRHLWQNMSNVSLLLVIPQIALAIGVLIASEVGGSLRMLGAGEGAGNGAVVTARVSAGQRAGQGFFVAGQIRVLARAGQG